MNVSHCISGVLLGFFLPACGSTDVHVPPPVAPTHAAESPPLSHDDKETSGLQSACKRGKAQACYNLGVRYEQGQGVQQDSSRAAALFEEACDGDIATACFELAVFAENGRGVAKDGARAAVLYSRACDGGEGRGCINFHTDACNRGEASSCLALADMLEAGDRVTQDPVRSTEFAGKACEAGHFPSCSKAGLALASEEPSAVTDVSRAAVLFTKGCDGNDAPSCNGLALAYANGRGVLRSCTHPFVLLLK